MKLKTFNKVHEQAKCEGIRREENCLISSWMTVSIHCCCLGWLRLNCSKRRPSLNGKWTTWNPSQLKPHSPLHSYCTFYLIQHVPLSYTLQHTCVHIRADVRFSILLIDISARRRDETTDLWNGQTGQLLNLLSHSSVFTHCRLFLLLLLCRKKMTLKSLLTPPTLPAQAINFNETINDQISIKSMGSIKPQGSSLNSFN